MNLTDTFSVPTAADWKTKISKDLKGEPLESLHWNSELGAIDPVLYEYQNKYERYPSHPKDGKNSWLITQSFECSNPTATNAQILEALKGGVNAIHLYNVSGNSLEILLREVMIEIIETTVFTSPENVLELYDHFLSICNERNLNINAIEFRLVTDPIGNYITEKVSSLALGCQQYVVNGSLFANAGGSLQNQLGLMLSLGHEYFVHLLEKGVTEEDAANSIRFHLAMGTSYFPELAKIRAFRTLWNSILKEYGVQNHYSSLHCETSNFYLSNLDIHNNLLRGTTAAMASVIGGADSIEVLAYDTNLSSRQSDAFRLAKNISLLLQEESYLNQVKDASNGAYYIEQLTDLLIEKGWSIFQEIDKKGGFLDAFESGFIKQELNKDLQDKMTKFRANELVLIGTNKYPNARETQQETPHKPVVTSKYIRSFRLSQTQL